MSATWPFKDPLERLPYGFNWSPRGISEENPIVSTTFEVVDGDVVVEEHYKANDGVRTITILSGGTVSDEACVIRLFATTLDGSVFDDTLKIKIKVR
jgi:hypothetical protein